MGPFIFRTEGLHLKHSMTDCFSNNLLIACFPDFAVVYNDIWMYLLYKQRNQATHDEEKHYNILILPNKKLWCLYLILVKTTKLHKLFSNDYVFLSIFLTSLHSSTNNLYLKLYLIFFCYDVE